MLLSFVKVFWTYDLLKNKACPTQALKYRSVTDIVRPIREIVRRGEKTIGHSVLPKWNWGW